MNHPAVDSLEQVVADMRAKYCRNSVEHEFADRIAALTRPPGGSERLRERIELVANNLGAMLQGWSGSTADTRDALTAELRDIAALASPQGAEQRQEECPACHKAWTEHRSGYSASRCKRKATPHPEPAASQGDAVVFQSLVEAVHCYMTRNGCGDKDASDYWRAQVCSYAAALSSPTGVQAAQVSDAELAWQNIETAEVEFLNNLAEKGGLADLLPGMLRHCARLVAGRKKLLWALTEYPKRNPQQLQATKVCAGVLKLAATAPQPENDDG